jgi:HSP20 family protein
MDTRNQSKARLPAVASGPRHDLTDQLIEPFTQLRTEVDRLFESFPFRLPTMKLRLFASAPALEMTETKKAYKISAELPGIDPANVEVTFEDGMLRIAGEKNEEREEDERGYRLSERSYGAFERVIELPPSANPEKISATFKNGLLAITVGKDGREKENVRKISIAKE